MVKGLLRFLAGAFLLVAVIAATSDVTRSMMAGERVASVSAYQHWSRLAPVTLAMARRTVERGTHPLVWDPVLVAVLRLPTWALFGLLGAFFAWAGRRRREVNVFAN